jgi:hypothetical protein
MRAGPDRRTDFFLPVIGRAAARPPEDTLLDQCREHRRWAWKPSLTARQKARREDFANSNVVQQTKLAKCPSEVLRACRLVQRLLYRGHRTRPLAFRMGQFDIPSISVAATYATLCSINLFRLQRWLDRLRRSTWLDSQSGIVARTNPCPACSSEAVCQVCLPVALAVAMTALPCHSSVARLAPVGCGRIRVPGAKR